ncbi:MAG: phosphatidate cytidylyltransferase [Candidatus Krumholzibacteria bacterium]|nr:phosphatidate cytidylyltransferase [Candidatus Krumholzibacteria bacterium]
MGRSSTASNSTSWLRSGMVLRVLASLVFIPCFVVIALRGGGYFLGLIALVVTLGMGEFFSMMRAKGLQPFKYAGVTSGLALLWFTYDRNGADAGFAVALVVMAVLALELMRKESRAALTHASTTFFGVIYVAFLSSHMVLLRELPRGLGLPYAEGSAFVFLAFAVTWSGDTGAYLVGRTVGRHPLLPRISRGKTVEGAVGGAVFAVFGALVARYTFAPFLGTVSAVALGLCATLAGLGGDLTESMIKRDADVKDASGVIPGHGGVLDRFDSLLFTAPLIYYFLKFFIL